MNTNQKAQIGYTANTQSNPKKKSLYFLIGFLIISFLVAFIIGGIYFGKNKSSKEVSKADLKDQVKISAKDIPNNPGEWKSYKLKTLGLELRLPESLSKQGAWEEKVIQSNNKGSIVCFSNEKSENEVCSGNNLLVRGTSSDFAGGTSETFTDFQGFSKENNKYFIKTVGGDKFELINAKFKEKINLNGVEIIKILGEKETPIRGTPGKGYLGAIINTKNPKYPGLSLQLKIDSNVSEYEFDQILESVKILN